MSKPELLTSPLHKLFLLVSSVSNKCHQLFSKLPLPKPELMTSLFHSSPTFNPAVTSTTSKINFHLLLFISAVTTVVLSHHCRKNTAKPPTCLLPSILDPSAIHSHNQNALLNINHIMSLPNLKTFSVSPYIYHDLQVHAFLSILFHPTLSSIIVLPIT